MSGNFTSTSFILKTLAALLRRIKQSFLAAPEEDLLDHSIISISANRSHL
ncbi:MAG: hypothetical protein ACK2T7_15330 [Anaerolineales bacterium]